MHRQLVEMVQQYLQRLSFILIILWSMCLSKDCAFIHIAQMAFF